jgi:hypothetical protein
VSTTGQDLALVAPLEQAAAGEVAGRAAPESTYGVGTDSPCYLPGAAAGERRPPQPAAIRSGFAGRRRRERRVRTMRALAAAQAAAGGTSQP